ncbi:MAG: M48 family metalloprotease [Myxococcota bacterium]|nr:M48 family metalloprotease [Myxococcota bacterium]
MLDPREAESDPQFSPLGFDPVAPVRFSVLPKWTVSPFRSRRFQTLGLRAVFCILIGAIGLCGGCARNPVTGRPEAVFTTEKGEIKQGREAAREVKKQMGTLDDPALQAYVNQLGQRLAAQSPRTQLDHDFLIVPMAEPNAFALPGGHIYVSRGLLAYVNSEDELANVIGHEIGHVAARHSVSRQTARAPLIPVQILAGLGGAAAGMISPQIGQMVSGVGQLPGALAIAAYSRDQEREADRLGQQFAAESGFDPMAMATFMDTLGREEALADQDTDRRSFLRNHPPSPARSADAVAYAETLEISKGHKAPLSREAFLKKMDGLPLGPMAAEGVFIDTRFLHAGLGVSIQFPDGWEFLNAPEAVAALQPKGLAQIVLQIVAEASDPLEQALLFSREVKLDGPVQSIQINGLSAARAEADFGPRLNRMRASLTWIAYGGRIYQISGVASRKNFSSMKTRLLTSADSFHPLTNRDRAQIKQDRLRLVTVLEGEDLTTVSQRSFNQWGLEETAIANGLEVNDTLTPGMLIKVSNTELYVGEPTPLSTSNSTSLEKK